MPQELFNPAVHKKAYGMVRVYVLRRSGTIEDVQDIINEGWYIFFKKAKEKELDYDCQVAYYLFGICKNLWLKELCNKNRQILTDSFEDFENIFHAETLDSDKREILCSILKSNLPKLSIRCQEIYTLKMEGLSCKEIAEEMGLNSGQISRNKIYTCTKRLRALVHQDPEYIRVFGKS